MVLKSNSSSLYTRNAFEFGPSYEQRLQNLGLSAIICPLVAPPYGSRANASSFTTVRREADVTGTQTGGASATVLIDSTKDFNALGVKAGDFILNTTDVSRTTILTVDSATQLTTNALVGGTDQTWAASDAYTITGGIEAVGTYNPGAPNTWTTPVDLISPSGYQHKIPYLQFNGSTEYISFPDADYWSRGDASVDYPFSAIAIIKRLNTGVGGSILSRFFASNTREWLFSTSSTDKPSLQMQDQLAAYEVATSTTAVAPSIWAHLAITYNGAGGTNPLQGGNFNLYINGSASSLTFGTVGTYVAMHNTNAQTYIGARDSFGATGFLYAQFAAGPCGIVFTHTELTADQILRDYHLTSGLMGLGSAR